MALVGSLWVAVGFSLRQLDNQAVINVFIKQDVSKENIDIMQKDLNEFPPVKEAKFLNLQASKDRLENSNAVPDSYKKLLELSNQNGVSLDFLKESFAKNFMSYNIKFQNT